MVEYVGEILEDGRLSISPDIRNNMALEKRLNVRLRKKISREAKGLSPQAQEL